MRSLSRQRSQQMIREHYHDRGWRHPYKAYETLIKELLVGKSASVLDVGCGREFPLSTHLLQCGAQIHGLDPLGSSEGFPAGVTLRQGTAEEIPYPDASLDVVISRCVFEHLAAPERAFREIKRVLKPEGKVVFLTPNKYDYVSIVAGLIPNVLHARIIRMLEGRPEEDTFPVYYRANSVRRIKALAGKVGLKVERLEHLNHPPYLLTFSRVLCRLAIAYDEWIRRHQHLSGLQAWILGVLAAGECRPRQASQSAKRSRVS